MPELPQQSNIARATPALYSKYRAKQMRNTRRRKGPQPFSLPPTCGRPAASHRPATRMPTKKKPLQMPQMPAKKKPRPIHSLSYNTRAPSYSTPPPLIHILSLHPPPCVIFLRRPRRPRLRHLPLRWPRGLQDLHVRGLQDFLWDPLHVPICKSF